MKIFIKVICFILLIGGAILSNCSPAGENATALPTASTAITAVFSRPTTFIATEGTSSPSTEVTASLPPSSSTIQIPSAPSTSTWVPALSEFEAEGVVIDLLRTNGGCRLPCFWGFVPRQVNLETLDSFFHAFYNIGGQNINIPSDNSAIKISVTWNYSDNPHEVARWLHVVMTSEREVKLTDGKYNQDVFDNPYFPQYIQYYTLPNLLSTYGMPSKAYIGIDLGVEMGFDNIFHLYLDYSEFGWGVQFRMPVKQINNFFVGCPAQAFSSFFLWSPEDTAAATENQAWVSEYGIFKPFEEATDLSLEDFYQRFQDFDNTKCLETPVDVWLVPK
jgi:hypothetical protein